MHLPHGLYELFVCESTVHHFHVLTSGSHVLNQVHSLWGLTYQV